MYFDCYLFFFFPSILFDTHWVFIPECKPFEFLSWLEERTTSEILLLFYHSFDNNFFFSRSTFPFFSFFLFFLWKPKYSFVFILVCKSFKIHIIHFKNNFINNYYIIILSIIIFLSLFLRSPSYLSFFLFFFFENKNAHWCSS